MSRLSYWSSRKSLVTMSTKMQKVFSVTASNTYSSKPFHKTFEQKKSTRRVLLFASAFSVPLLRPPRNLLLKSQEISGATVTTRWSSALRRQRYGEARVGSLPVLVSYNLIPLSAESGLISKTFRQNFFKIGMRLQNAILRIRLNAVWPEKLYMLTYGGKWGAKTEKRNTIFG